MNAPLVTVVITTFNRRRWLEEAMDSVRTQTMPDWEMVVVDDASEDGTADWLPGQAAHNVICLRHEVNREKSESRNRGLTEARGRYILFLDDDDRLLPDALERLLEPLQGEDGLVGALGGRIKFFEDGRRHVIPHARGVHRGDLWREFVWGWSASSGQALFSTAAVRAVGGYASLIFFVSSVVLAEDRDLWLRLSLRGSFAVVPAYVTEYRDHGQITSRPAFIRQIRNRIFERFYLAVPHRRGHGRRLRQSRAAFDRADALRKQRRWVEALGALLWSSFLAGSLVFTPVMRAHYGDTFRRVLRPVPDSLRALARRVLRRV